MSYPSSRAMRHECIQHLIPFKTNYTIYVEKNDTKKELFSQKEDGSCCFSGKTNFDDRLAILMSQAKNSSGCCAYD